MYPKLKSSTPNLSTGSRLCDTCGVPRRYYRREQDVQARPAVWMSCTSGKRVGETAVVIAPSLPLLNLYSSSVADMISPPSELLWERRICGVVGPESMVVFRQAVGEASQLKRGVEVSKKKGGSCNGVYRSS